MEIMDIGIFLLSIGFITVILAWCGAIYELTHWRGKREN